MGGVESCGGGGRASSDEMKHSIRKVIGSQDLNESDLEKLWSKVCFSKTAYVYSHISQVYVLFIAMKKYDVNNDQALDIKEFRKLALDMLTATKCRFQELKVEMNC